MGFFAGVDTHRDNHAVTVIDRIGSVVDHFTIEANPSGYALALERTAQYPDLIWGLEGTGSYGRSFAKALSRKAQIVYEVPGTITKRHRRRLRGAGKSDPQDAHAIAEAVLRDREHLPRYLETDAEEATRLLYERRDRMIRERTAKVNRIRALALRLEVQLPSDVTSRAALTAVVDHLSHLQTQGYADFEALDELRDLLSDLERIQERVRDLEKRLRPFVDRLAPSMLQLRGCSLISAAGLVGHIGSTSNYRDADAFAAHAGAAPAPCSSGKYESWRLRTGGNRQLNRCLHNIAKAQVRTPDHLGKLYYDRKRAEGKTHREALRSLKRRLATVVFRLLRADESTRHTPSQACAA